MAIGQDLLNVPMGDMIRQMAFAIADAQVQLDESSLRVAEMMSGERVERNDERPADRRRHRHARQLRRRAGSA